jgi:alkylation response protein AidB-like acyl-CoA dehydrogenase
MDLNLTVEQQALQDEAVRFARKNLSDGVRARDHDERFDRDLWQRCADYGLLSMPVPAELGGLGLGLPELLAVMEGLGYGGRDMGLLFSLNAHIWTGTIPILTFGTPAQKDRYLAPLCNGSWIAAHAAT